MTRTASEALIHVMEDFGESEPKDVLVIYTNQAGDLCWSSSTDSQTIKFGLLEMCKQSMIKAMKD
jgi:hypothetical protein